MKNEKQITQPVFLIIAFSALILCAVLFLFIAYTINSSLDPGDYGNADVSRKQKALEYVGLKTGIDVSEGDLYFGFDDHDGSHGDGKTYLEVRLPVSIDIVIWESGDWKRFPVPERIDSNVCKLCIDKHRRDHEELLPQINNGWYYFIDRTPEYAYDYKNFTIAAYNSDSKVFYFCQYDS